MEASLDGNFNFAIAIGLSPYENENDEIQYKRSPDSVSFPLIGFELRRTFNQSTKLNKLTLKRFETIEFIPGLFRLINAI